MKDLGGTVEMRRLLLQLLQDLRLQRAKAVERYDVDRRDVRRPHTQMLLQCPGVRPSGDCEDGNPLPSGNRLRPQRAAAVKDQLG